MHTDSSLQQLPKLYICSTDKASKHFVRKIVSSVRSALPTDEDPTPMSKQIDLADVAIRKPWQWTPAVELEKCLPASQLLYRACRQIEAWFLEFLLYRLLSRMQPTQNQLRMSARTKDTHMNALTTEFPRLDNQSVLIRQDQSPPHQTLYPSVSQFQHQISS